MSRKRKPKTEGFTWLNHSFSAFNGMRTADRSTPEKFVASYIRHKRHQPHAVALANQYMKPLLERADYLIKHSKGSKYRTIKGRRKKPEQPRIPLIEETAKAWGIEYGRTAGLFKYAGRLPKQHRSTALTTLLRKAKNE